MSRLLPKLFQVAFTALAVMASLVAICVAVAGVEDAGAGAVVVSSLLAAVEGVVGEA